MSDLFKGCRINERRRPGGGVEGKHGGVFISLSRRPAVISKETVCKVHFRNVFQLIPILNVFPPACHSTVPPPTIQHGGNPSERRFHQESTVQFLLEAANRELIFLWC